MKNVLAATFAAMMLCASFASQADLQNCENLYVGQIMIVKGRGLSSVVLLKNSTDNSGSYWVHLTGWTAEEKAHALSIFTAAKLAGHRVNVTTSEADGCGISKAGTELVTVTMATNP
jgi:hypothetical protein